MERTLGAIESHRSVQLQIIATGMHLDTAHGKPLSFIREAGFKPNINIAWPSYKSPDSTAHSTGQAMASLATSFQKLKTDIVLVVGDRVEAFAAASAAHISQIPIAHVHGGDRALGEIDDSLRHAISKLSHIHFPATRQSAQRLLKLGEDKFRIHSVGSPGLDNILETAADSGDVSGRFALIMFHPTSPDVHSEESVAGEILSAVLGADFERMVIFQPNNDPGCQGIRRAWEKNRANPRIKLLDGLARNLFLGLLRDAAVLVGNSSSGIIEAASFGTPVINIGHRQKGRERNKNVIDVPAKASAIRLALKRVWNNGQPIRFPKKNLYGSGRTSEKIARILATVALDDRLRRKLISY